MAEQLRRPVPGGIGTYVRGLAQGLDQLGGEASAVTVWSARLPPRLTPWAWDHGFGGPAGSAGDLVHATSLALPPVGRRRLTVMVHDLAWRRFPDAYPARGRRWHEAALGRALHRADLLLTPSTATADDLLAAGAALDRVEVVEEGCDHLDAPDEEAASVLLDRLGVRGPFALAVSTLEPRKNLPRLLAAFAAARPRLADPETVLLVVGPAGWGPALAHADGAVLAGSVSGGVLTALYRRARALAYVPLYEGFGLPAVEAMACGTPVVASPMPSTGGAALEVDPTDVARLADALVQVCADEAVRSALVAQGWQRARSLKWCSAARRHVELWASLQ